MSHNRCLPSPFSVKSLLPKGEKVSQIYIITGIRGAGKSQQCQKILMEALLLGLDVRGFISFAVFEEDRKTGIELVNIADDERRVLAGLKSSYSDDRCRWLIDQETVAWGNRILEEITSCDVLIIDELGPLEFRHESGLQAAFDLVDAKQYQLAFVVVRPKLVPQALVRWPEAVLVGATLQELMGGHSSNS